MAMLYRGDKGTLLIDKRFPAIGRIQKRSGTTDPELLRAYVDMMDHLYKRPENHPILRSIKNGVLTCAQVYEHYERQDLKTLLVVEKIIPLDPALVEWVDSYGEIEDTTRKRYRQCVQRFLEETDSKATVNDLPALLEKFRGICEKATHDRKYNQTRAVIQSYLAHKFGQDHPLYTTVTGRKTLKMLQTRRKREPVALLVPQAVAIAKKMPKKYTDMMWTMLYTGMLWHEFDGSRGWEVFDTHINIHGTKREARERVIPLIPADPTKVFSHPMTTEKYFRTQLHTASVGITTEKVQIKDLRNTFNVWMVEAGIPKGRRESYMGHEGYTLSDLYEAQDVKDFLKADALAMRNYINREKDKTLEQVKLSTTPLIAYKRTGRYIAKRGKKAEAA